MGTEYCDRYDYHRAYGRYPDEESAPGTPADEAAPPAEPEPVVTAKVVTKPKRSGAKTSQVAETKQG